MFKKGDASIVATVILIVSAITIAVVVTTFSKQTEEKVSDKIIKLGESVDCESIRLSVEEYDEDQNYFTIMNRGTLGVDEFVIRVYDSNGVIQAYGPLDFSTCNDGSFSEEQGAGVVEGRLLPQKRCRWALPSGEANELELIPLLINKDGEKINCESRMSYWEK